MSLPQPYKDLLDEVLSRLKERFKEKLFAVVVYGSVARGEARKDSDIDLLIVADGLPDGIRRRQETFLELEKDIEPLYTRLRKKGYFPFLSPLLKTPAEAKRFSLLYLDMLRDSVVLHEKAGFFSKLLRNLESRLGRLGAKRVQMGKKWYWVLKPDAKAGEVIELE